MAEVYVLSILPVNQARAETFRMHGSRFKASSEQYRTFHGEHYIAWLIYPTLERIAAYRAAGIACAKRGVDLYVRESDADTALKLDRDAEAVLNEEPEEWPEGKR